MASLASIHIDFRRKGLRAFALFAAMFVAVAATHETLYALEQLALQSHCSGHKSTLPDSTQHQDHACALCELAGAPTLVTLHAELPLPQVSLELDNLASRLEPAVRDESCFPHFRRGPPAHSIV